MKLKAFVLVLMFALLWIVVLTPAHIVTRFLPANAPLVLQGFTGSVWSGTVAQAALFVDGQTLGQGRLVWDVQPWSLLHLAPCVDFAFEGNGPSSSAPGSMAEAVAGVACVSAGGELKLQDVAFDLPARRFLRSPELRLGGEISGLLTILQWRSGALEELRGQGLWSNATILSDQLNLSLHTLPFDVRRESSDSLTVQIDNGGLLAQQPETPLHISLQSAVSLDGRFHTRATLTTRPQTPDEMIELLNVLAEPQGAGAFTLEMRSAY